MRALSTWFPSAFAVVTAFACVEAVAQTPEP